MTDGGGVPFEGELDVGDLDGLREASEFLRMWSRPGGEVTCVIDPPALGADPMLFGMALADALRHGAKACAHAVNVSEDHAFARIRQGLDAELNNPTDTPRPITTGMMH